MTARKIRWVGISLVMGAPWLMSYIAFTVGSWTVLPATITGFIATLGGLILACHAEDFA